VGEQVRMDASDGRGSGLRGESGAGPRNLLKAGVLLRLALFDDGRLLHWG
jgi:hypothetical protein